MINPETIEVNVTYGSRITFFLKMIGIAEEAELRSRELGLPEKERAEKQYDLDVQILKDLSVQKPEGIEDGDKLGNNAADVIDNFFRERTPTKERIAFYAVRAYYVRLLPAESFF